jgi:hypothetical protein
LKKVFLDLSKTFNSPKLRFGRRRGIDFHAILRDLTSASRSVAGLLGPASLAHATLRGTTRGERRICFCRTRNRFPYRNVFLSFLYRFVPRQRFAPNEVHPNRPKRSGTRAWDPKGTRLNPHPSFAEIGDFGFPKFLKGLQIICSQIICENILSRSFQAGCGAVPHNSRSLKPSPPAPSLSSPPARDVGRWGTFVRLPPRGSCRANARLREWAELTPLKKRQFRGLLPSFASQMPPPSEREATSFYEPICSFLVLSAWEGRR